MRGRTRGFRRGELDVAVRPDGEVEPHAQLDHHCVRVVGAVDSDTFLKSLVIFGVEEPKTVGLRCRHTTKRLAGDVLRSGGGILLVHKENLLVVRHACDGVAALLSHADDVGDNLWVEHGAHAVVNDANVIFGKHTLKVGTRRCG